MKIKRVAFGNACEAFVENRIKEGVNIISSDSNNKGKTILIQAMMFALGNEPTFPASFEYKKYYYFVEFEEQNKIYRLCRYNRGYVLKVEGVIYLFDNTSELKRFWDKNIFHLPKIYKNERFTIVDPVLYYQIFFSGQDKKDTSNIVSSGFYKKSDFREMLFACVNLDKKGLSVIEAEKIKEKVSQLKEKRKELLKKYSILKSTKKPLTYLSSESDRLAFGEKVTKLKTITNLITDLNKSRNLAESRKNKWNGLIYELNSLNSATVNCHFECMNCHSKDVSLVIGKNGNDSFSFDVSNSKMREEIKKSIVEKVESYEEEVAILNNKIKKAQEELKQLLNDDQITIESIVLYKSDIFSVNDAEIKLKGLDDELSILKGQLTNNSQIEKDNKDCRYAWSSALIKRMNEIYKLVDPEGNQVYADLFSKPNEVYSGSEATVFHLVKLFALKEFLNHRNPIIVDSFRAEDLSTYTENKILDFAKNINTQIIFTTTLKMEEVGKYDSTDWINHINYQPHSPSHILNSDNVDKFKDILSDLFVKINL